MNSPSCKNANCLGFYKIWWVFQVHLGYFAFIYTVRILAKKAHGQKPWFFKELFPNCPRRKFHWIALHSQHICERDPLPCILTSSGFPKPTRNRSSSGAWVRRDILAEIASYFPYNRENLNGCFNWFPELSKPSAFLVPPIVVLCYFSYITEAEKLDIVSFDH